MSFATICTVVVVVLVMWSAALEERSREQALEVAMDIGDIYIYIYIYSYIYIYI
jgi:hypothetical protein